MIFNGIKNGNYVRVFPRDGEYSSVPIKVGNGVSLHCFEEGLSDIGTITSIIYHEECTDYIIFSRKRDFFISDGHVVMVLISSEFDKDGQEILQNYKELGGSAIPHRSSNDR